MHLMLVLFVVLIGGAMAAPELLSDEEEWTKFKTGFKKTYEAPDEESRRCEVFRNNLKNIKEHNEKYAKGEVTYAQGVNQFADLTSEEFKTRFTRYRGKPKGH